MTSKARSRKAERLCGSLSLRELTLGEASFHVLRTLKQLCGEAPVHSEQIPLPMASTKLAVIEVSHIGSRTFSPVRPSGLSDQRSGYKHPVGQGTTVKAQKGKAFWHVMYEEAKR